jgi:hypothetical protein
MQRLAPGPHRDNLTSSPGMLSSTGDCICQRAVSTTPTWPASGKNEGPPSHS